MQSKCSVRIIEFVPARKLVLLALSLSPLLIGQPSAPPKPTLDHNNYVGSNVCQKCHPDIWSTFYKNPHYKTLANAKTVTQGEPIEPAGCETCHGPGGAHVAAGGGKATIVAFSELQPKQVLDNCLRCHSETLSRANIRRSAHTLSDVVCSSCHSIHKSSATRFLLAKKQTDLCYGCHTNIRAQFSMPSKHRVNEGFMNCSDCHNPHGAFAPTWNMASRPRMMEQALGNEEPCLKCHSDKRGPFVFEHAAVRVEGCERCHFPHGSPNPRLMRRPVVFTMCLECHNGADSFGRRNQGITIQTSTHNMADPRYQNCTTCHVRIHGSNADARFLR
jgi:DmsE family decaheme c-type cytochrome